MGGDVQVKLGDLRRLLGDFSEAVVAFSGGVDSSLLAVVAHQVLGGRMIAAIADSPSLPRHELSEATRFARRHAFALKTIRTWELDDPRYRRNSADRCGFCKDALLDGITANPELAGRTLLLGVNTDDLNEFRPGQAAAQSRGARFPLAEAGLSKEEVRALSRELGLETWDKPAAACLASRIAYGVPVTSEALGRVERAEDALRSLGLFGDVRVRDHGGDVARIEVDPVRFEDLLALRGEVVDGLHDAGFRFVTMDLEGFRSGSQNLALMPLESLRPGSVR
jgi:uncharacterized protein